MKILATQYTLSSRSLELYTAGCLGPHCVNCYSPETWSFDQGLEWDSFYLEIIKKKLEDFSNMIDRISIFGGEPLDNPLDEVVSFLRALKAFSLPLWLFTRKTIEEVPEEVKELCSYIKCGRYDETKKVSEHVMYGITLASSNQIIYKMGS